MLAGRLPGMLGRPGAGVAAWGSARAPARHAMLSPLPASSAHSAPPTPPHPLQVLPKVLNTCAVLLADRGLAASQRALSTFCSLHRLLLALCEQHGLWGAAAARLDAFLGNKAQVGCSCCGLQLLWAAAAVGCSLGCTSALR
jgi:hypothetical protein